MIRAFVRNFWPLGVLGSTGQWLGLGAVLPGTVGLAPAAGFEFFQPQQPPRVFAAIAHRGESRQAPENTRPALQRCIDDLLEWAEVDVRLTRDGEHVLAHGASVTDGVGKTWPVADATLSELKKVDVGSAFGAGFAGEPPLSLKECFDLCKGKLNLYLDCKAVTPEQLAREVLGARMDRQVVLYGDLELLSRIRAVAGGKIATMAKWWPALGGPEWAIKHGLAAVEIDPPDITAAVREKFERAGVKVQVKLLGDWDKPVSQGGAAGGGLPNPAWDKALDAGVSWAQTDLPEELLAHAFWRRLPRRPVEISLHRGAGRYAPENTLPALAKAQRMRVDYVEFDVRATRDGEFFLLHDSRLNRTTDGNGPISESTADSVRKLSAGIKFGKPYADVRIPSLEEFLSAAGGMGLYFDAKAISPAALAASLEKHGATGRAVVYHSPEFLAQLKAVNPAIRGLAPLGKPDELAAVIERAHPYGVDADWGILSKDLIARCHAAGVRVFSDALGRHERVEDYLQAIDWGIDVIQTDHPLRVLRALELRLAGAAASKGQAAGGAAATGAWKRTAFQGRSGSKMRIASGGVAHCAIVSQLGATAAERHAAEELSAALRQITGAVFQLREEGVPGGSADGSGLEGSAIVVGFGPVASQLFPDVAQTGFGAEEYVIRTRGGNLLLAGGRPRGTLYAVYRFLQEHLGVRWYTPWFTHMPSREALTLGALDVRGKPAFEYRDPFWFPAFDGDWAARNGSNSQSARLNEEHGGRVTYKGFVHTFYPLVPPDPYFKTHPEWFALVNGKRVGENAQLCTTDPQLRDFIVERVKAWLRESPEAGIVSVSQNDHAGACECPRCAAVDEREGSHAGSLLELVNYVAEKIEPEFPRVLVDTLAYQYTRKAPKSLRPRSNVVIRLCSIECNFARPLDDPSNASFARDIKDWSRLTSRLYVWDYTTDFSHYLLPFPNYYVLGSNARFFHDHGVMGLFEQGAYQSFSSEMSELRAWVLAQLLWNPYQDDRKLVREFLEAYYGVPAAAFIRDYLQLIRTAAQPYYVGIGHPDASPYLRFETLARAERLWQRAEDAARGNADQLWRLRQARLPIGYIWLSQWVGLRREARELGRPWPIDASRAAYAARWLATVNEPGPAGWAPMSRMREAGQTPAEFVAQVSTDLDEALFDPPKRHPAAKALPDLPRAAQMDPLSVQDDRAIIFGEPDCARPVADSDASDGVAIRMVAGPGGARGAMEIHGARLPKSFRPGRYEVYYVVRVEKTEAARPDAPAFSARIHDPLSGKYVADRVGKAGEIAPGYHPFHVGTVELNRYSRLWLGHAHDDAVKAVWFDRALLVPAP